MNFRIGSRNRSILPNLAMEHFQQTNEPVRQSDSEWITFDILLILNSSTRFITKLQNLL